MFGDDRSNPKELDHVTADENDVYSHKGMIALTLPNLPKTATEKRSWDIVVKHALAAIDKTPNKHMSTHDYLTKWIALALNAKGDQHTVLRYFHRTSHGLNMLDRHIGKLMASTENMGNPVFGTNFATYAEWCGLRNCSPKGRVYIAMVSLRYQISRQRGQVLSTIHLYNIQLASYKQQDIMSFCSKVRLVMANLKVEETYGQSHLLFNWLFEKFKQWSEIREVINKIRDSQTPLIAVHLIISGSQLTTESVIPTKMQMWRT